MREPAHQTIFLKDYTLPEFLIPRVHLNVEFFDDLGSPGGAAKVGLIHKDHAVISVLPPQGE